MSRRRPRRRGIYTGIGAVAALLPGFFSGGWAVAAPAGAAQAVITLSAAPDGRGQACTQDDPCALTTAQAQAAAVARTGRHDVDVVLRGGTYRLGHTLAFDAARGDGGRDGHTVTYSAAPGARPVLSGGRRVGGWRQGPGGVWQAVVPAGTDTRQLYVDGVRAVRARGSVATHFIRTATGYTTSDTTLAGWKDVSGVQFAYNVGWTQMSCGVASVTGATVTMDQPCFDNSTRKPYGVNADQPSFLENARELLDDPGEFYLDKAAHTLFYMPRQGQDLRTADVEIPRLQTLVSGTGTEAHPLTGLAFEGISFAYGGWTEPDGPDGFSDVQANVRLTGQDAWEKQGSCDRFSSSDPGTCPYGNWTMTPGNVVFDHTRDLTITGGAFEHLGAAGLQLGRNVMDSTIRGNVFTDVSANGLEIGDPADAAPADLALLPTGNTIADNRVHDVAVEYTGGVGILQLYTRDDVIEHNQIDDVPYSGISSNWGWGHTDTRTSGNAILGNLVFDAMQQHYDGGGIYVLGQEGSSFADGLLIKGNVVRNDGQSGHAIYTDGGSEYVTMTGNAMFGNATYSMGGCKEAGLPFGHFSFTGNYVEDTAPDWGCGDPEDLTLANTPVAADGSGVPADLLAGAGLEAPYAHLATAPAGVRPVDLAAGKPAQAQYVDGTPADLQPGTLLSSATDGDQGTWVQASGQFRWQLVVDLGQPYSLGMITVSMPRPHFATDFHADVSTDGSTWTTVGTVHDAGWGTVPVTPASPVTGRYLRIVADKPDDWGQRGDQMAISEVGAYAPVAGQQDLAAHAPAQALFIDGTRADMQPGSQPSFADDQDPSTWSQATGQYRWIQQIDLGRPRSIDLVSLQQPDDKFATDFHIAVSSDGWNWNTVARRTGGVGGLSGVQLDSPVTARFLRVVADRPDNGGQTGGQMAITEIGAYGLTDQ